MGQTSSASQVHREVPPRTSSLLVIPECRVEQLTRVCWSKQRISCGVKGRFCECRHISCSTLQSLPTTPFNGHSRRNFREPLPTVRRKSCAVDCHNVTDTSLPCHATRAVASASIKSLDNVESRFLTCLRQIHCAMVRGTHAAAILGPELYSRLPNTRVLLVGAGGIGCELCESPLGHDRDDVQPDNVCCSYKC
jgi:hypothetical protein